MNRDLSRSRAILIGNAVYRDPKIPNLAAATGCVTAMAELLSGDLCGWPDGRIETMVDATAPHEVARRVIDAVRGIQDVVLLYYVGHGIRTANGQLALALRDTDADPEKLPDTATLYEAIARMLRGCPASTKLVILDCCHAELGNKAHYQFQSADIDAESVDGLYFIGASKVNEKAKTPLSGGLTYFTDAFIDVVRSGIPAKPPELRLDQIFVELRARMVRASLPEPVESGIRDAHRYPFARNAAPPEVQYDPAEEISRLRRQVAQAEAREHASNAEAAAAARELERLREQTRHALALDANRAVPSQPTLRNAQSRLYSAMHARDAAHAEYRRATDALGHAAQARPATWRSTPPPTAR